MEKGVETGKQLTRVVIEHVSPAVDGGLFPAKTSVGDVVPFEADVFTDGHDLPAARVIVHHEDADPQETPMVPLGNDHWRSDVPIEEPGTYRFRVEGWIDSWATWRSELERRLAAGQDVAVELKEGAGLVGDAARRARAAGVTGEADRLKAAAAGLRRLDPAKAGALATSGELNALMGRHADRRRGTAASAEYVLVADRERARHGAWYELFPRSVSPKRGRHGTLRDVAALAPDIADLGFDVLYLPPIHPIGRTNRKGPNNAAAAGPDDPGSPWAIGSEEGGHTAIHPELGTFDDFGHLLAELKRARHGARPRPRLPVLSRPSMGARAPRVVPAPRRRHDPLRREPAEEVRGHLPSRLRNEGSRGALERAARRGPLLVREGRPDLPRRQPAHEAVRLLGMAARGGQERPSRRPVPVGGVHPPARDGTPGQDRLRPVLHVLRVAADQARS